LSGQDVRRSTSSLWTRCQVSSQLGLRHRLHVTIQRGSLAAIGQSGYPAFPHHHAPVSLFYQFLYHWQRTSLQKWIFAENGSILPEIADAVVLATGHLSHMCTRSAPVSRPRRLATQAWLPEINSLFNLTPCAILARIFFCLPVSVCLCLSVYLSVCLSVCHRLSVAIRFSKVRLIYSFRLHPYTSTYDTS